MRKPISLRRLDGIVLLDKPSGMSSNAALQVARRLFGAEKAGHTGSLDPLATGLLPLCFGEATKIAGLLLGSDKAYETEIALGCSTDTDDADGQVLLQRPVPSIDQKTLHLALTQLTGTIYQRAPIYSALKQGGQPLYARARRGEIIQAPQRQVQVHSIEVLEQQPQSLRLDIVCGTGTYIRSIARDLGELLGCGAHITALRRLWVAPFRKPTMLTLDHLRQLIENNNQEDLLQWLLPLESGLTHFPQIILNAELATRFYYGQRLHNPGWPSGQVAIFNEAGRTLGLAQIDKEGGLAPQRRFNWKENSF